MGQNWAGFKGGIVDFWKLIYAKIMSIVFNRHMPTWAMYWAFAFSVTHQWKPMNFAYLTIQLQTTNEQPFKYF